MNNILARVALSSIIAVVGGIALMNVSGTPVAVIGWWLLYAIAAGIALAPQPPEKIRQIVAMAAFPAVVPLLDALVIQTIMRTPIRISAAPLSFKVIAVVFIVNWVGIWLFSYAHQSMTRAIAHAKDKRTVTKLQNIEKTVRAAALCITSIALTIAALGYTMQ